MLTEQGKTWGEQCLSLTFCQRKVLNNMLNNAMFSFSVRMLSIPFNKQTLTILIKKGPRVLTALFVLSNNLSVAQ